MGGGGKGASWERGKKGKKEIDDISALLSRTALISGPRCREGRRGGRGKDELGKKREEEGEIGK